MTPKNHAPKTHRVSWSDRPMKDMIWDTIIVCVALGILVGMFWGGV